MNLICEQCIGFSRNLALGIRKIAKERNIAKYCYILTNREIAGDRGRSRNIAKYRGVSRGIEFDERMDPTQLRRTVPWWWLWAAGCAVRGVGGQGKKCYKRFCCIGGKMGLRRGLRAKCNFRHLFCSKGGCVPILSLALVGLDDTMCDAI